MTDAEIEFIVEPTPTYRQIYLPIGNADIIGLKLYLKTAQGIIRHKLDINCKFKLPRAFGPWILEVEPVFEQIL